MFNCKLALALVRLTAQPRSGFWRNKGYESALFQLLHLKRSPNPSTACLSLLKLQCYTFNIIATSCPHSLSDCEKCTGVQRVVSRSENARARSSITASPVLRSTLLQIWRNQRSQGTRRLRRCRRTSRAQQLFTSPRITPQRVSRTMISSSSQVPTIRL